MLVTAVGLVFDLKFIYGFVISIVVILLAFVVSVNYFVLSCLHTAEGLKFFVFYLIPDRD